MWTWGRMEKISWTKHITNEEVLAMTCSLLSGSLAMEALLIGVHCKKRYINV